MKNIAIIDDEKSILEITKECLLDSCNSEIQFLLFDSPSDFLDSFAQLDLDLIITDISMPIINGIELSRRVREAGYTNSIIFQSGFVDEHFEELYILLNTYFFSKPTDFSELGKLIDQILSRNEKVDELTKILMKSAPKDSLEQFKKHYQMIKMMTSSSLVREIVAKTRSQR